MAKVTKPNPDAPKVYGQFVVANTKWGRVVKKWPRKRKGRRTPYQYYHQSEFGLAGKLAADPFPLDYAFALSWSQGTDMVPRDILTMLALGLFFEFEGDDLPPFQSWRRMSNNPQYWLDLITDTVGAILLRAPIGWVAIEPGNAGQVLTMEGGLPVWKNSGSGGGSAAQWSTNLVGGYSGSGHATKGALVTPGISVTVLSMGFPIAKVDTATYRFSIFHLDGYQIDELAFESDEITATDSNDEWVTVDLETPLILTPNDNYAFVVTRTDGSGTTPAGAHAGNSDAYGVPMYNLAQYLYLDDNAPGIGDTFSHGGSPYAYGLRWST